jgi:hypothetical protein
MMTIFLEDGKMDVNNVLRHIIDNIMFKTPTWIVPSNSQASISNLPGGMLVYNGPQPKIIKL